VGTVREDASDGVKHFIAQGGINRLCEDRSAGDVSFEQRFDVGLEREVATATVVGERHAVLDATGHRRIEHVLRAFPAVGVPHTDT
jgi:hypothetical protein